MEEPLRILSGHVALGPPGCAISTRICFRPDGGQLTYLHPDARGKTQLRYVDLRAESLSSQLLLETQSEELQQLARECGVHDFEWAARPISHARALICVGPTIWVCGDLCGNERNVAFKLYSGGLGRPACARISPKGTHVAFVIGRALYLLDIEARGANESCLPPTPRQLTPDDSLGDSYFGMPELVASEEMDRQEGFWWSPDGSQLLFTRVDEYQVPLVGADSLNIHEQGQQPLRYPFAGTSNARVSLILLSLVRPAALKEIELVGREDVLFATPAGLSEFYLARAGFWPDGSVMAQIQNRSQSELQLLKIDAENGGRIVLVRESSAQWVNLHNLLHVLPAADAFTEFYFIWGSERSGFRGLYLYHVGRDGTRCVTPTAIDEPLGEGVVLRVCHAQQNANGDVDVWFMGNHGRCTEAHLFNATVALKTRLDVRVTQATQLYGCHECTVSPDGRWVADVFSSARRPFHLELLKVAGDAQLQAGAIVESLFADSHDARLCSGLPAPTILSIPSSDGTVVLQCAVYVPTKIERPPLGYPALVDVYGGPTIQTVRDHWLLTADLRAQRFAQNGFVVIKCDNRGSANRGARFEGALGRQLGSIELQDQEEAVRYLADLGTIDPGRVAIYGWSYGGFLSAMSVCSGRHTFQRAAAGAPVTHWDGYNTHYTERYLGHPGDSRASFEASSLLAHVWKISAPLLVIHGLQDRNVHVGHTARLVRELRSLEVPHSAMFLPQSRHYPHQWHERVAVEDALWEFFCNLDK